MVQIRIGQAEVRFPEEHWEAWVSAGRVPPDALIFSLRLTGGLWKRADSLELYQFFRKTGEEERREAGLGPVPGTPFAGLLAVAFPRRGFSGTEMLLGLNFAVALGLVLLWGGAYAERLGIPVLSQGRGEGLAWDLYNLFVEKHQPIGFLATLFIHANVKHLMANMLTLAPSAAFTEYLYGRRVYLVYLVGGLAGAIASFLLKDRGPMSVGASGAIYGLIGTVAGFVFRHYRRLPRWHRWKARRIYIPLLVLATLPSIFYADWFAHIGGLLCGMLLGLILPLGKGGRSLLLPARRDQHSS